MVYRPLCVIKMAHGYLLHRREHTSIPRFTDGMSWKTEPLRLSPMLPERRPSRTPPLRGRRRRAFLTSHPPMSISSTIGYSMTSRRRSTSNERSTRGGARRESARRSRSRVTRSPRRDCRTRRRGRISHRARARRHPDALVSPERSRRESDVACRYRGALVLATDPDAAHGVSFRRLPFTGGPGQS